MISSSSEDNDTQLSGNELDESSGEEDTLIRKEKQDSELELDDVDESDLPPIKEEKAPDTNVKRYRAAKKISLLMLPGLCLLMVMGYIHLKDTLLNGLGEEDSTRLHGFQIPKDQLVLFDSFVIPLREKKGLTYIFLSISFNVPNKELKREITVKRERLRGIIYDILREEIDRLDTIPPLDEIKRFLVGKINIALSVGKINKIYITKYLAV